MTNIHLLPGLGFDERIFAQLNFPKGNIAVQYLNWQEPLPREGLGKYTTRVSEHMEVKGGKNILIGHSFGGILAQEIAKIREIEKIIEKELN